MTNAKTNNLRSGKQRLSKKNLTSLNTLMRVQGMLNRTGEVFEHRVDEKKREQSVALQT